MPEESYDAIVIGGGHHGTILALIVDDEPDMLDTWEELLSMRDVVRTSTFNEAETLLKTEYFDMAILDIMGVDGYCY